MKDPQAYRLEEVAEAKKAQADGVTIARYADAFMELYREGVQPSDLEKLAIKEGERAENRHDYEHGLQKRSSLSLKKDVVIAKVLQKYAGWMFDRLVAGSDRKGVLVGEKEPYTLETLERLELKDADMALARQCLNDIEVAATREQLATKELKRRGVGVAQAA